MNQEKPHKNWKAIAAMSANRVIGCGNAIPWHLPEDFKWFKHCTLGNVIVMGRKTFDSLKNKALPNRTNIVLTRNPKLLQDAHPEIFAAAAVGGAARKRIESNQIQLPGMHSHDVRLVSSLDKIQGVVAEKHFPGSVFICGGAQIYEQALPLCAELLLTRVKRTVEGDAFFPAFEHLFQLNEIVRDTPDFTIERWTRRGS